MYSCVCTFPDVAKLTFTIWVRLPCVSAKYKTTKNNISQRSFSRNSAPPNIKPRNSNLARPDFENAPKSKFNTAEIKNFTVYVYTHVHIWTHITTFGLIWPHIWSCTWPYMARKFNTPDRSIPRCRANIKIETVCTDDICRSKLCWALFFDQPLQVTGGLIERILLH